MIRSRFSFLFVLFVLLLSGIPSQAGVHSFQEYFDQERQLTYEDFSPELLAHLKNTHVVFVDGIMNELARLLNNYFTDNIREVDQLGLTYSHLRFSSRTGIPENGDQLFVKVSEIFQ